MCVCVCVCVYVNVYMFYCIAPPTCNAHTITILLHDHYAMHLLSPRFLFCISYTIQNGLWQYHEN